MVPMSIRGPWLDSVTPIAPPASARPTYRFVLYAGVVTGAYSGVICLILYAFARVIGVPFEVQGVGGVAVLPWIVVLLLPLAAGVAGAALAGLLRGVRFGGRIVLLVGTVLALLSCISPIVQPAEVIWSTRIWLLVMHVITWLLVVPQIARIVGDADPGAFEEREGG
jgi:hypothetical protein